LPGLPAGVKLGLAGGPRLVAMVLARFQRIGPVVWYLPRSASLMLKELGIALFLASVGLRAGDQFFALAASGSGLRWLLVGACVTMVPPLVVGAIAIRVFGMNYVSVTGLIAGSTTDPPALAFANAQAESEAPSIAYATVYPLSMILRVVCAQLLVIWWTS
jgi:putative transport protein